MPKSISIYIPDHLAEQMETFSEVNWSEISRISIEDYINGRRRYENLGKIIEGYFEDIDKLKGKLERLIKYEQDVREGYTSQTMFTSGEDKIICSVTNLIYYIEKMVKNTITN